MEFLHCGKYGLSPACRVLLNGTGASLQHHLPILQRRLHLLDSSPKFPLHRHPKSHRPVRRLLVAHASSPRPQHQSMLPRHGADVGVLFQLIEYRLGERGRLASLVVGRIRDGAGRARFHDVKVAVDCGRHARLGIEGEGFHSLEPSLSDERSILNQVRGVIGVASGGGDVGGGGNDGIVVVRRGPEARVPQFGQRAPRRSHGRIVIRHSREILHRDEQIVRLLRECHDFDCPSFVRLGAVFLIWHGCVGVGCYFVVSLFFRCRYYIPLFIDTGIHESGIAINVRQTICIILRDCPSLH
mmetsp:Transcript_53783/g.114257  ORF Transcript_53783/g.114257 Transcript_53783/m.114257 type:complete len:299 (+) Transcript_53783:751-1647(+)